MKNKLILILVLTILVLPFIYAQPPFQQSVDLNDGYEIKFPALGVLKQNQDFEFSFHVFNISNGVPIEDNSTTSCYFHLYNSTGHHLSSLQLPSKEEIINEWAIDVDKGNFSMIGSYSYLIQCNSSSLGGFESVTLEVNGTGLEFTQSKAILFLGTMGLLIFFFMLMLRLNEKLPSENNYDDEGTLISINQLRYVKPILYMVEYFLIIAIMFIGSNLALAYMGTGLLGNVLFRIFQIMLGISLPIIVVWFVYILYSIFQDKKVKEYTERGWEFDG